jgi:AcrR family transcriptional regulator
MKKGKTSRTASRPLRARTDTRERILAAAMREFSRKGYSGARVQKIAVAVPTNIRMIYHFFGSKEGLYVQVLERGLRDLRAEEQKLPVSTKDPVQGLLTLFDFIFDHFATHRELVALMSNENIHGARFLRRSRIVPTMSSPTIAAIGRLLERASLPPGERLDPLQLYVTMVALSYFHLSNAHTLSIIFRTDLHRASWIRARHAHARKILAHHLRAICRPRALKSG